MYAFDNRYKLLNRLYILGLAQLLFFILYFYLILTGKEIFAYLLPLFFINLCLYPMLISYPQRMLIFFLIMLPFSAIGLFPTFYREIFLYFISIFGIFFLYITQFINKNKKFQISTYPISRQIVLLIAALVISFIHAVLRGWFSFHLLRHSYLMIESIVLLLLLMNLFQAKKDLLKASWIIFLACIIANLIFLSIAFMHGLVVIFVRRAFLPFASYSLNENAIFLGPFIVLGTSFLWLKDFQKKKTIIFLGIFVLVSALVITQSRGSWFAVLGGILYLFFKKRFYKGIVALTIFIAIFFTFQLSRGILTSRLEQIGSGDLALLARFSLWKAAIQIIKENWLFGVGANNFILIKYQFGVPFWLDPVKSFNTHNIYLEILVNLGVLGFIGFFGLIWKTLVKLTKVIKYTRDNELAVLSLGLKGALLTFLIHGLIDCGLFLNVIYFSLMILLGFSWAIININDSLYKVTNKDSKAVIE